MEELNRVKLTIKTEEGVIVSKIGTSAPQPKNSEYSNLELIHILERIITELEQYTYA